MKKTMFSVIAVFSSIVLLSQEKVTIEPSGNIVTKNVIVQPFTVIKASGLYDLILSEGDKEAVKIEADDNLQKSFSVSSDGSKLLIDMPELKDRNMNFKNKKERQLSKSKVFVTYKKLSQLDLAVVGNVSSATAIKSDAVSINSKAVGNITLDINSKKLDVNNKGVGNITLKGTATNATVTNAGVGQFDGHELIVQTMDIDNSGIGSAEVNVEKDLKIKQSFLGKVRNKGNAKTSQWDGVEI